MSSDDSNTSQFMGLTGVSSDKIAKTYLEFAGDDVSAAIDMYFNDPTLATDQQSAPAPSTATTSASSSSADPPWMSSGPSFDTSNTSSSASSSKPPAAGPGSSFDADAALAASLAKEDKKNAAAEDQVRKADARKRDVLVAGGGGGYGGYGGVGGMVGGGAFYDARQAGTGQTWDVDEEDMEGSDDHKASKNLSDMFSSPTYSFVGPFQAARQSAKESKRWMLVNIQSDSDFACHALNRDVWKDEMVESLVQSGFIFWQQSEKSDEAKTYIERYQVQAFPHIAFVDPRTSRKCWSKEGWSMENPVTAETFMEAAVDFCDRNSFDRPPAAPRSRAPSGAGSVGGPSPSRSGDLAEADALEAALRASMDDGPTSLPTSPTAAMATVAPPPAPPVPSPAPLSQSVYATFTNMTVPPEPESGGSRINFRLCSSRAVRAFAPSTPIAAVFAFVAQKEGADGKEFELRAGYPPKVMDPEGNRTVEELKLNGETVTMRWKD